VLIDASQLLGLIDLTRLNEDDTTDTISALCDKALAPAGTVAAVCILPAFVKQAKAQLSATSIKIATVANFPHGTDSLDSVLSVIHQAIHDGADEIDVVFPYLDYLAGDKIKPFDFIRQCKAACGNAVLLKVILETGALIDSAIIAEVSYNVCHAGADFLKTSTGKVAVGATLAAARIMLDTIKKIPRSIGIKVSGGVRTIEEANQYIELAAQTMGAAWVTPDHFRIGASQLVEIIINHQMEKQ
jgi:deoxyribose-phosphate aldolase